MREPKSVAVTVAGPKARVRSIDAVVPRSASRGPSTVSRVSPAASVSSVSGVAAKNPRPTDTRLVQPPPRISAASRGLANVPYSLCTSTRRPAETASHDARSTSSCANRPGTTYE